MPTESSSGEKNAPRCIAKDFPFRLGGNDPAIPRITAIDTVYLGQDDDNNPAFIISDFKVAAGNENNMLQ